MKLTIRQQTCHLLADKAVYWEEQKALIVADIHLGKDTTFRKAGIPIPEGIMEHDLSSLKDLIDRWPVKKCLIVGDLIHHPTGVSLDVQKKFFEWLQKLSCEVHLIIGNHDRMLLTNLPKDWSLTIHENGLLIEPFYFSHYPKHDEKWFVWSGHLHPVVKIKSAADRLVLRCFQIFSDLGILPAFSEFVGGSFVRKSEDCEIYAIADDTLIQL